MAKDNHASYAKVGFTVIVGFAAVVAVLVYFGGMRGRGDEFLAETYYDAPVSGLSVGSEVNFRGVKVGEVKSISFIGADYAEASEADMQKIRIVLAFNRRLLRPRAGTSPLDTIRHLVRKGVRATVSSSGITGLSKVELNYPMVKVENEKISWVPEHTCIPPAPSILESFADSATKVMNHLNDMDLAKTCSNITSMVESAAKLVGDTSAFVDSQRPTLDAILANLESASEKLKMFADAISDEPSLLLRSREVERLPETSR